MDLHGAATSAWVADGVAPSSTDGGPHGPAAPPSRRRPRGRRWWLWAALGGLAIGVAGAAYHWTTRGPVAPQFVTAPVTRGNVAVALTATGTVNPVTVVEVGTYVSGPIVRWFCDYNTTVKVG
ncbi:MAG TPA: efflux RND transporter periplasmic adaptor subunit, partial [Streptosporangiaceae bacterium]|nr:efflux RND transporter periplasmic adaptor subunit [Streptosporangiaceae bacterium]